MPTSDSDLKALRELGRLSAESKWVLCQAVHEGETSVCGRLASIHAPGGKMARHDCGRDSPANKAASRLHSNPEHIIILEDDIPSSPDSRKSQQGSLKKEEVLDIKCVHCFAVAVGAQALIQHYRTEPALHDYLVEEAVILSQYPELAHGKLLPLGIGFRIREDGL